MSTNGLRYKPGDIFAKKYEVRDSMKGSMGIVYLLRNLQRKSYMEPEYICAKTFSPQWLSTDLAKSEFIKEAENWLLLGRYEHIVYAYDYEEVDNQPYIYIQYADSGSLRDLVNNGFDPCNSDEDNVFAGIFSFGLTLGMKRIYDVLDSPHGDLSIDNILFCQQGKLIKISDFGIMSSVKGDKPRGIRNDVIKYGKVLWYIYTGVDEGEEQIKTSIPNYDWIDQPIRELILNSIDGSARDGRQFFNQAIKIIDDYFYSDTGKHLITPEQYHLDVKSQVKNIMDDFCKENWGIVQSKIIGQEPESALINRAAALTDLNKIEEAYNIYLEVLKLLRIRKDSDESKVVWRNLQLLFSKIPDINLRRQYFQRALSVWNAGFQENF